VKRSVKKRDTKDCEKRKKKLKRKRMKIMCMMTTTSSGVCVLKSLSFNPCIIEFPTPYM